MGNIFPDTVRQFDYTKDLEDVADIIEACFNENLDEEGSQFIQRMRSMSKHTQFLVLTQTNAVKTGYPMTGYVWEDDGELIGNLNIMPIKVLNKPSALIANVAVSPEHRKQGIAKKLTEIALTHLRKKGIETVWLQVRDDNPAAISLYANAGFEEITRRTAWVRYPGNSKASAIVPEGKISQIQIKDWHQTRKWLEETYAEILRWNIPIKPELLHPGLRGYIKRSMSDSQIKSWAYRRKQQYLGSVYWQTFSGPGDFIWVAADPQNEEEVIRNLLPRVLASVRNKKITSNYPVDRAKEAWKANGFSKKQTLIWMRNRL